MLARALGILWLAGWISIEAFGGASVQAADKNPPDAAQRVRLSKLKKARQWTKAKSSAKAEAVYRELLGQNADDPEVSYELAVLLAESKKMDAAVQALLPLGASKHPQAAVFRVEARLNQAFAPLRGQTGFRKIVRIDREPDQVVTAYERLVGTGGKWEQAPIACDKPLVKLQLARAPKQNFELIIESQCRGDTDRTKLDGTWQGKDPNQLIFTLPNPSAENEMLSCEVEICSGEDCVHCGANTDMEFLLLPARR